MVKRNIYVASSWRNEYQQSVVRALRDAGHEVYDFRNPGPGKRGFAWSEIDPDWKNWTAKQQIEAYEHTLAIHGLGHDFAAMNLADSFVMVMPAGRSAALELGWAIGAKKRTFVLMMGEPQEPELMLRLAHHLLTDIDTLVEWLKR